MSRVKSANTGPELQVRRLVWAMGFRYRLHDKRLSGKPDLVFRKRRKVIFVHGCFWHGHIGCKYAGTPKTRVDFWTSKIVRNRERDQQNEQNLLAQGWKVLIVWQCELKDLDRLSQKLHDFLEKD